MPYRKIKKDGTPALSTKPKKPAHRPLKVAEADLIRITNDYIKDCQDKKLIPLRQELALILGIDTDTLNRYSKSPRRIFPPSPASRRA